MSRERVRSAHVVTAYRLLLGWVCCGCPQTPMAQFVSPDRAGVPTRLGSSLYLQYATATTKRPRSDSYRQNTFPLFCSHPPSSSLAPSCAAVPCPPLSFPLLRYRFRPSDWPEPKGGVHLLITCVLPQQPIPFRQSPSTPYTLCSHCRQQE